MADEDYFETFKLSSCCKTEDIEKIADCKQSEHFQAWKYNEEKTLKWLEKKILRLSNHLKEKNYNVMNLAVSSNYVKSNSTSTIPESKLKNFICFKFCCNHFYFLRCIYALCVWNHI